MKFYEAAVGDLTLPAMSRHTGHRKCGSANEFNQHIADYDF
jgi:hypothetical protein